MNRTQAEANYKKALNAWNAAVDTNNLAAFEAADSVLTIARRELVAMEIKYPTAKEVKRQDEKLRLRNRGLDV